MSQYDLENKLSYWPEFNLLGKVGSTTDAAEFLKNKKIDLIFLDLHLEGLQEKPFIKILEANKTQVVWLSGNKNHTDDALNYNLTDILVKPYTDNHFVKTMILVLKRFKSAFEIEAKLPHCLFVRSNKMLVKLPYADILYVEALSDYVIIHTKPKKYTVHSTMKVLEDVLPPSDFFVRITPTLLGLIKLKQ
ncbi:MAG: LytTR family transcriptional regulator DNA-binding domain-containing protein [Sphingobacteriales bacterium JAD_PAG50586_3]|nr:MAG: LytTR family transcriptional regulator DNA-binding domain-containing protein [Sphingobacteriales bacterium JAD_PAG50586_3]